MAVTQPTLRTSEAARQLGVSPNTLRSWEKRYGRPTSVRSDGGHRRYDAGDIARLREIVKSGLTGASAIEALSTARAEIWTCCPHCGARIEHVDVRIVGQGDMPATTALSRLAASRGLHSGRIVR
jgi:hypothetical protein